MNKIEDPNSNNSKKELFRANPLMKKLDKLKDQEGEASTYQGVYKKCMFFMAMIFVGILMAIFFDISGAISIDPITTEIHIEKYVIILLLVAAGIFIIFPFLAFILRATIPVTGSLYCVSIGFLFAFCAVLSEELGSYIILALILTLAIVAVMGFLFSKGIIRVTAKFRATTTTLFSAMVIGSLLLFVCYYVPSLRDCILYLTQNPLLSILGSVVGMVIAIMFLLTDFENIREAVESKLPKKHEWYASFSLIFTVVWVYLKVLDIVMQIKDGK